MKEHIKKQLDLLISSIGKVKNDTDKPVSSENKDRSRDFEDPVVVLAFELIRGYLKCYFYCTDKNIVSSHIQTMGNQIHTSFHSHNFLEIAYVVDGTLRLLVNESVVEFKPGEICLMDYSTLHGEMIDDEPVKVVYLSLLPDVFESVMNSDRSDSLEQAYLKSIVVEKKNTYQYVHFIPSGDTPESLAAVAAILDETVGKKPGAGDIIKGNIIRLLHLLTTEYTMRLSSAEKAQVRRNLYHDICAYIKNNARDIKIEDLEAKFHYNADFFNRLIKEFSGMTYTEYLRGERLHTAEKLLSGTDLPISAIADRIGYQNIGYFYKIFREKHGLLPSEYRKKIR